MDRIIYLSTILARLLKISRVIIIIFIYSYWIFFPAFDYHGIAIVSYPLESLTINYKSIILCMIISILPVTVSLYGINKMIQLVEFYKQGIIFSKENALIFYRLGHALLWYSIADCVFYTLVSIALTYQNPPGKAFIEIGISETQIICVALSFFVAIIGKIMLEAYKHNEELKYTV